MEQRAAMTWARRLKRVFAIDIIECEKCQAPVKINACIEDTLVIKKTLNHLNGKEGEQETITNRLPPTRAPPWLPGMDQGPSD